STSSPRSCRGRWGRRGGELSGSPYLYERYRLEFQDVSLRSRPNRSLNSKVVRAWERLHYFDGNREFVRIDVILARRLLDQDGVIFRIWFDVPVALPYHDDCTQACCVQAGSTQYYIPRRTAD